MSFKLLDQSYTVNYFCNKNKKKLSKATSSGWLTNEYVRENWKKKKLKLTIFQLRFVCKDLKIAFRL